MYYSCKSEIPEDCLDNFCVNLRQDRVCHSLSEQQRFPHTNADESVYEHPEQMSEAKPQSAKGIIQTKHTYFKCEKLKWLETEDSSSKQSTEIIIL